MYESETYDYPTQIQESITEHTRDLALSRGAGSAAYLDATDDKIRNVRKQLDSSSDREKLEGLKVLIAVRMFSYMLDVYLLSL